MTARSDVTSVTTKLPKEILVYRDEGFFTFPTGDSYDGGFEIRKKDQTVKMCGLGVYKTAEGDTYCGTWENDKLVPTEPATITFKDNAKYEGTIKDCCYSGNGTYTYPDRSILNGNFVENCPDGTLTLTDPNGHVWLGKAELGFGWFEPLNHFYKLLDSRENPKMKQRKRKRLSSVAVHGVNTK